MRTDLQSAKKTGLTNLRAMKAADVGSVGEILAAHVSPTYQWRGVHPFNEQSKPYAVAKIFWQPLMQAFSPVQRRNDVFIAGDNQAQQDGSVWVLSMGHLLGRFDKPWLGIPPTRKIAMMRFAEFHRIDGDRIAETAMICDILHLIHQAGLAPLPHQTAAPLVQPGPMTHDGLLHSEQSPDKGAQTLALVRRMMSDLEDVTKYVRREDELRQHWAEDMLWWGPGGIGATANMGSRPITGSSLPSTIRSDDALSTQWRMVS